MYKNVGAQLAAVGGNVIRSTEADEIQSANISEALSNQIRPTDPNLPPKLFLLSKAIRLGYHVVLDKLEPQPLSYYSIFESFFPNKCISLEQFARLFK
jgi:hypothetical protein